MVTSVFAACMAGLLFFFSQDCRAFLDALWTNNEAVASQNILQSGVESSWSILYHLGGNGPWVPNHSLAVDTNIAPPATCRVEQVHMVGRLDMRAVGIFSDSVLLLSCQISRHAERYPTVAAGLRTCLSVLCR